MARQDVAVMVSGVIAEALVFDAPEWVADDSMITS